MKVFTHSVRTESPKKMVVMLELCFFGNHFIMEQIA